MASGLTQSEWPGRKAIMTFNDFAFEVKLVLSLFDGCESPAKPVFHERRIIQPLRSNVRDI